MASSQVFPISAVKASPKKEKTKAELLWPSLVNVKAKGPNSSKILGVYKRRAKARMAKRPVFAHEKKDAVMWYDIFEFKNICMSATFVMKSFFVNCFS